MPRAHKRMGGLNKLKPVRIGVTCSYSTRPFSCALGDARKHSRERRFTIQNIYKTYTRVLETETNNKKNWYKYKLTKKWILTVIKAERAAFHWWYKMVLKAVIKLNSHFCCTCSPRRLLHTGLVAVVSQSLAF